jgi:hypothetical protein
MPQEDTSFGEPIRKFRVKLRTRLLIGFCGLVMILLGATLLFTGSVKTGAYPIVLGFVVVALAFLLPRLEYLICPGGIVVIRSGNKTWCRWEDFAEIIHQRIKHGIVSGRMCVLVRKTGTKMSIADTGIGDFGTMIALLREQATARGIPWKEEQIIK